MPFRDPVLLALLGGAVATMVLLFERRRRAQLTVLDRWAARQGMSCERYPPLSVLAPLEPLGLLPPVVAVERMVTGVLRAGPLVTSASVAACLCGNQHKARPFLLGAFAAPPELPTVRLLPLGDTDVREDLGFTAMPAEGLPDGYRAESFQPLSRRLTRTLGAELRDAQGLRVELRPGRLLLAALAGGTEQGGAGPEQIDGMIDLGLRLLRAATAALQLPAETPDPPPDPLLN